MKKYTCTIGGVPVSFQCDECFEEAVKLYCSILEADQKLTVTDGKWVQTGWCIFHYHQTEEGFQFLCPDLKKAPFKDETEDLSLFFAAFYIQCRALELADLPTTIPVSFADGIVARKSALKARKVYLQRCQPTGKGDSGWYLGTVGEGRSEDPGDYQKIYAYELILYCQGAIQLLQLPMGTLAVLEDGKLIEAVDEKNRKIL